MFLRDLSTGKEFTDHAQFLITATGILNKWQWPDIKGRESFKGEMVHSAKWDPELTVEKMKDLNIALIGAGSSGIQILPQIQSVAKRVDHYMASKTWISPIGFGSEELTDRGVIDNCMSLHLAPHVFVYGINMTIVLQSNTPKKSWKLSESILRRILLSDPRSKSSSILLLL